MNTVTSDQTTTQPSVVNILVRVLAEHDGPMAPARIAAHPACRDWTERVLFYVLRDAVDRGVVQRVDRSGYELTAAGRAHLG